MSITIYYIHEAEYLFINSKNIYFRKKAFKCRMRHLFDSTRANCNCDVAQIQNFCQHTTLCEG
jgi:hypothetical protein